VLLLFNLNQTAKPVDGMVAALLTWIKRRDARFACDGDNETGFLTVQPVVSEGHNGPRSGTQCPPGQPAGLLSIELRVRGLYYAVSCGEGLIFYKGEGARGNQKSKQYSVMVLVISQ